MNTWEVVAAFHGLGDEADLQSVYVYLERHAPMRAHLDLEWRDGRCIVYYVGW